MSVDIEPLELSFRRPFTQEVSQTLNIKNTNTTPVAFKVKTTAPKQYCVRPNSGRIEPGQDFDVTVLLQAMKQEPPADAKCRDKFLVQSASITGDKEFASIGSVLDTTDKSSISERKIRVNWLAAGPDDAAPTAVAGTPNKQSAVNGGSTDTPEAPRAFASPGGGGAESPSSAPPPYSDEVKSESEDVKPETPKSDIAQDNMEATQTDRSVRQRIKSSASSVEKKVAPQLAQAMPQNAQGVPVKITALLCVLAFLVGYLFF